MKKLGITLAVVAFAAVAAQAQTASANVVGYNKNNAERGVFKIASVQFEGSTSIRDIIGDAYPLNTIVYQFNTGTGEYQTSEYKTYADIVDGAPAFITGWATDLSINVGEGFWFYNSITSKDWVANKPF